MKEKLEQIKATIKQKQDEFKEFGKQQFNEVTKNLFDKYPELQTFTVRGYTPYFNDGDTCYYSVHTYGPELNGEDFYESKLAQKDAIEDDIGLIFDSFPNELFKDLFGDHVIIIFGRDNVKTEDYEHD